MWVFSKIGFFSTVQKPWDVEHDTVTVRARCRDDLVELRKRLPGASKIKTSATADYKWRVTVRRAAFADLMRRLSLEIDYSNFKSMVMVEHGIERERLYERVWNVMYELQEGRRRGWEPSGMWPAE